MRLVWSFLLVAACKAEGDDYPINPGGDDGNFVPRPDATPSDAAPGDGTLLTGRACVLSDLRQPTVCADTGAADIIVQLGGRSTMTSDNGSFMIASPGGSTLVWNISGTGYTPSVVPFSASNILPVLRSDHYANLSGTNGVIINNGEGSLVLYVTAGGAPASGATVSVMPTATYLPMGDTNDPLTWVDGATGPFGASWIPGITDGTPAVTVNQGTAMPQVLGFPVHDGAVTFATVAFP